MKTTWKQTIFDNFSYKLVALFISLILWVTILGRRDFQVTKSVELDLVPPIGMVVDSQSVDHVKVKVAGPRTALRRFLESGAGVLTVDLAGYDPGAHRVSIPTQKFDVPFGVKVISVRPSEIDVHLQKQ
jgi:YbbR domain-containing protein